MLPLTLPAHPFSRQVLQTAELTGPQILPHVQGGHGGLFFWGALWKAFFFTLLLDGHLMLKGNLGLVLPHTFLFLGGKRPFLETS